MVSTPESGGKKKIPFEKKFKEDFLYQENHRPGLRGSFVFNRQNENNYKKTETL